MGLSDPQGAGPHPCGMQIRCAGNDGDVYVEQDTLTATLYQISDTAKSYYKKLNEEYHKGIIEAETFTQSYDQYIARLSTGAVLGMFDQGWNFGNATMMAQDLQPYLPTTALALLALQDRRDLPAVSTSLAYLEAQYFSVVTTGAELLNQIR